MINSFGYSRDSICLLDMILLLDLRHKAAGQQRGKYGYGNRKRVLRTNLFIIPLKSLLYQMCLFNTLAIRCFMI